MMGWTWLLAATASATPDAATLQAAWERDVAALGAHGAGIPVALTAADLAAIAKGAPMSRRLDTEAGNFAIGAHWMDVPVEAAWIATQDAKDRPLTTSMKNVWLTDEPPLRRVVYMLMPLPWPIADRQWVAEFKANPAVYGATQGRVWQRAWSVAPSALATEPDPDAMWVEVATGAWTMLDVADGTLAVFAVRTVLGGSIPTDLSQSWAVSTIKGTLKALAEAAETVPEHYDADHAPIYAPDGARLPPGLR